jgi:alcohol dehydrogenase
LPIIAIPTTAGTGSDLTKWATIWDPETDRKLSLNRPDLYAEAVLVDPAITASLPWGITLASGLDALSHALESIWNVNANQVTRTFAIIAARDILLALPRLQANLGDMDARVLMARGATNAGLAFSNTQTALAHNISYPITLRHGVAHGIACSFSLPEIIVAVRGSDPECDAALVAILGDLNSAPLKLRQFLDGLAVPATAMQMGIDVAEWQSILAEAFAGPRGRNFIGTIERYPTSTKA